MRTARECQVNFSSRVRLVLACLPSVPLRWIEEGMLAAEGQGWGCHLYKFEPPDEVADLRTV